MNKILIIDDNQGLARKIAAIIGLASCPTHIDALKLKQMCDERMPARKANKSDRKRNRANRW